MARRPVRWLAWRGAVRWGLLFRLVVIAAIAVGIWYLLRGLDLANLGEALADARPWPVVVASLLSFVILACKALSWRVMLAPQYLVPIPRLIRYTITAFAASVIAPARAGEVLRVVALKRQDGVPVSRSAAVAIAEKILDGISMVLVMAPLPWLIPGLPRSVTWWIVGLAGFGVALIVAIRIAMNRTRSDGWLGRLVRGMEVLRQPRRFAAALAILIVGWLIDLANVWLILWAVGIDLPPAAGLLVLFSLNLAIAVPSTPGQLGALELGALVGLEILHVPRADALAFALLYHAMQVVPLVMVGLILDFKLLVRGWPAEVPPAAAAPAPIEPPRAA
jgi:uncharacterized membrane protein YbhN (UPF0104 family)